MSIKDVGYATVLGGALAGSFALNDLGMNDPEIQQEIVVESQQAESQVVVEVTKEPVPKIKEMRFEGKNDRIDKYQRDSFKNLNWDTSKMTNGQMVAVVTVMHNENKSLKSENKELKSHLAQISSAYKNESSRSNLYEAEYKRLQGLINAKKP
ncbi:MAG: hypothetical protein ACRBHB_18210 [Arenicella sp.]